MKTRIKTSTTDRLGAYLTVTVGTSLLAAVQSDAAIHVIDIGPTGFKIDAVNGGVADGTYDHRADFPVAGGGFLIIHNHYFNVYLYTGLAGSNNLHIATNGGYCTPTNFSSGNLIDSGSNFNPVHGSDSFFQGYGFTSPDFNAGSFMGFETAQGNYGWLEVTWNSSTEEFKIISGA